ncbi:MAG: PQQ-binding-like beta-propeller repeat protein [Janthinobacterium lividum]
MNYSFLLIILLPLLAGCETFFGKKHKDPLPGERIQVLLQKEDTTPDKAVGGLYVGLPNAVDHQAWTMGGGNARHVMEPGVLQTKIQQLWQHDVGAGNGNSFRLLGSGFLSKNAQRLLNGPIAAQNVVYTIDAEGTVTATSLKSGEKIWQTETIPVPERSQPFGGGLAYENGKIYAATANAQVLCLNAEKGDILWRVPTSGPVRTGPTVQDNRVFVVTINNQLETYEASTGKLLWTHTGIIESAGLLGGASPAVHEGVVVVPYSSGEVFALRAESGYPLWSETLNHSRRLDSLSSLSHIKARPIIDRNLVFLVGYSGHMSALDLRNGQTVWSKEIGGIRTPALAGDFLFMVTNESNLICLKRDTGQIIWTRKLPAYVNPDKKDNKILWAGPIVANNQLVLAGSHGKGMIVMADSGKTSLVFDLPGETSLSPILVDKTLVFLTDSATLVAYR